MHKLVLSAPWQFERFSVDLGSGSRKFVFAKYGNKDTARAAAVAFDKAVITLMAEFDVRKGQVGTISLNHMSGHSKCKGKGYVPLNTRNTAI